MIHIQIPKDVKLLMPAALRAELKAASETGPVQNIGGTACYEISPAAARTIASMYGQNNENGPTYLWSLAHEEKTLPSKVHNEIDDRIELVYGPEADEEDDDAVALLQFLKGWLYLMPSDSPFKVDVYVPLQIDSISVTNMIGRYVTNMNDRAYKITDVRYNLRFDKVTFELSELDEDGDVIPGTESGIMGLQGWTLL